MNQRCLFLLAVLLAVTPGPWAAAQSVQYPVASAPAPIRFRALAAPDQVTRSCIQTVDGYAYLGGDMTLDDAKSAAFAEAKRRAVEAARTHVQSKTRVEDFTTLYDVVWTQSEGEVRVLEQKDHGLQLEPQVRYHVWIKAEVCYDLVPVRSDSARPDPGTMPAAMGGPLTVGVWTRRKAYADGEFITVFIQGNRDFYARIVCIDSQGNIVQLLPNRYRDAHFFRAGHTYRVPDTGDRFWLKAGPPYGRDRIVVYASDAPLGDVSPQDRTPLQDGRDLVRCSRGDLGLRSRGIGVVGADHGPGRGVLRSGLGNPDRAGGNPIQLMDRDNEGEFPKLGQGPGTTIQNHDEIPWPAAPTFVEPASCRLIEWPARCRPHKCRPHKCRPHKCRPHAPPSG